MRKAAQAFNLIRFAAGATSPSTGPAKVAWDVTHRCNLRCKHCHLWQIKDHSEDLSTEEGKRLISELSDIGTIHLSFSGGEPFIRKDIYEMISFAREKGLTTAANTNATLLKDPDNARKAIDAGLGTAFISLDGPDAETHNDLRGHPQAFQGVLQAIENITSLRSGNTPRVFINTTITGSNLDDLEKIVMLARDHGVDGMTMSIIQDIGKYSPEDATGISTSDAADLGERLCAIANKSGGLIPHSSEFLKHFQTYLEDPNSLYRYRCAAGYAIALVHPNGEVHPCPVPFARMGNIREKSFSDIWFSDEANEIRKKIKQNHHPICWFDCIAPLNVLMHNVRKLQLKQVFHGKTLTHIARKASE